MKKEDLKIVTSNPEVFNPIYKEWDKLETLDCKCVKCPKCKRELELVNILSKNMKYLKKGELM